MAALKAPKPLADDTLDAKPEDTGPDTTGPDDEGLEGTPTTSGAMVLFNACSEPAVVTEVTKVLGNAALLTIVEPPRDHISVFPRRYSINGGARTYLGQLQLGLRKTTQKTRQARA